MRERLAVHQETLDLASWDDLRCNDAFERNMEMAGLVWKGTAVLTPVDRDVMFRVPSRLDHKKLENYQLRMAVERVQGDGPLRICFPLSGYQTNDNPDVGVLVLDGGQGGTSGLDIIGKQGFENNSTTKPGSSARLAKGDVVDVIVTYRPSLVQVHVDGEKIVDCDEVKRLHLPNSLKLTSFSSPVLILPRGTQFRIVCLGLRDIPDIASVSRGSSSQGKGPQEDLLSKGAICHGRDYDNNPCTMKVLERNQAAGTARLEFSKPNGWKISMIVNEVAKNGSGFEVGDIKRLGARVKIWDEKGRGSASATRFHIIASWKNAHPGEKGFVEFSFSGRR